MGGSTVTEARDNFVHFLRESLSCVTTDYLTAFPQSAKLFKVWFENPGKLLTDEKPLFLSITQVFTVGPVPNAKRQYKAGTREYSYRLLTSAEGESEILSYHWHPNEFEVRYPHLHIASVPRIHFPTSRVCLEDFILLLTTYYDVKPRMSHAEWTGILKKNKAAFDKHATWKIQP